MQARTKKNENIINLQSSSVLVSGASFEHSVVVNFKYYEYSLLENTNHYTDSEGLAAPHYELLPTDSKLIKVKTHEQ